MPLRSILGSDIARSNPAVRRAENPFSEAREPGVLVPTLQPDLAVLPVQRADRHGNAPLGRATPMFSMSYRLGARAGARKMARIGPRFLRS